MAKNANLSKAKSTKNDEFYTQLVDIENELKHYKHHFRDKVVLCNCDDPFASNFFKYFAMNFNFLGLKKLIATHYAKGETSYKIELTELGDVNEDGAIDLQDVEQILYNNQDIRTQLTGDGDFRSEECIELLKESDIVVTNPPFSLFREYVAQLIEYDKKFLILGNLNAIAYKKIFPLLKDNKMWLGWNNGAKEFLTPDNSSKKFGNIGWYTNLPHTKQNDILTLYKKYTPEEYPHYDNYDAIEVSKVVNIPENYGGVMGVPITFLNKYNSEQFEIIDINPHFFIMVEQGLKKPKQLKITGQKDPYARILIKRKGQ